MVPRVSLNAAYYRRWYGNLLVTDNAALAPTDYSPYSVTAPVDAASARRRRLQGHRPVRSERAGGRAKLRRPGVELRRRDGALQRRRSDDERQSCSKARAVSGGLSVGRVETNYCFVTSSPQGTGLPPTQGATTAAGLLYCDVKPPFQPNVKLLGVYPLPWGDVNVRGDVPEHPRPHDHRLEHVHQRADQRPRSGAISRPAPTAIATVQLIQPGTMYDERLYQLDLRGIEDLQSRAARASRPTWISTTRATRARF